MSDTIILTDRLTAAASSAVASERAEPGSLLHNSRNFGKWTTRSLAFLRRLIPSRSESSGLASPEVASTAGPTALFGTENESLPEPDLSLASAVLIVGILTGVTFVGSISTGIVTIAIPGIARDLKLPTSLLLWPASVFPLASGCCLILAGCVADFIGNRFINLAGCLLLSAFTLASGLSRTGIQLILFRAFQGVAISLCLPTAVSILTHSFPAGRQRNIGFACIGVSQPLGFALGLVLGGVVVDTALGWRFSFYLTAGLIFVLFFASLWMLPADRPRQTFTWRRFGTEIDWLGVICASAAMGVFSYVFAVITADMSDIRRPETIALLCLAASLAVGFVIWMDYQEKKGRHPLIPNSLWKQRAFTTICIMVLLSWAVLTSMEYFISLFFQEVQQLTALDAAIRFLPSIVLGVFLNLSTGFFIHQVRVDYLLIATACLTCVPPLLMALINPSWGYWNCAFWAVLMSPLSADVIFTVANLIITDAFPSETQALAGAVFNTVAQFGNSLGIMIMAVISSGVTMKAAPEHRESPEALMEGYRAAFWTCFAMMSTACIAALIGLRKVGKVGLKRE